MLGTSSFDDPPPGTAPEQIALHGADGARAEALLARAKAQGAAVLAALARRAVARLVRNAGAGAAKPGALFTPTEQRRLGHALAATIGTAHLLGAARIRRRADQVQRHSDPTQRFSDVPTDLRCFDETGTGGIEPMPPVQAVDYFKRLVPGLSVDAETFAATIGREAFTLAVTTDKTLLDKVHGIIAERVATGQRVGAAAGEVQAILEAAGVAPANPQYSEMVVRTGMMESYNAGAQRQLAGLADVFPVWEYANPGDSRSRPEHAARAGKYWPAARHFTDVRGTDPGDVCNCRCVLPGNYIQGNILAASKAVYSGEAVELITRLGQRLAVTVNHPVLTAREQFVAAGEVEPGDYLVSYVGEMQRLVPGDNVQDGPALIEDVFGSFDQLDALRMVKRWTALDFHGEGLSIQREVHIVGAYRHLLIDPNRETSQRCNERGFRRRDMQQFGLAGSRPLYPRFRLHSRFAAVPNVDAFQGQPFDDGAPGQPVLFAERVRGRARQIFANEIARCNVGAEQRGGRIADRLAALNEFAPQGHYLDLGEPGQIVHRCSGPVALNQFVDTFDRLRPLLSGSDRLRANLRKLRKLAPQGIGGHADFSGERNKRLASVVALDEFGQARNLGAKGEPRRFGMGSELNAVLAQPVGDGVRRDAELFRNLMSRFPGKVALDEVLEVRRFHYAGPVFDLQTTPGYYVTGCNPLVGTLLANCTFIPIDGREWADLQAAGERAEDQ